MSGSWSSLAAPVSSASPVAAGSSCFGGSEVAGAGSGSAGLVCSFESSGFEELEVSVPGCGAVVEVESWDGVTGCCGCCWVC